MADKTVEDIITESKQNTLHNPWITIESAASRIALGKVVKGEEWRENEKIQEMYKALYAEAYKVEDYLQTRMNLGDVLEWLRNNEHIPDEIITKYPKEIHQELVSGLMTTIERIYYFDESAYRTFNEICSELRAEYGITLVSNETLADLENCSGYKNPYKDEKAKLARARYMVILNTVLAEADKYGLVPQFTPDEKTKPDYFYFVPVSYKSNAPKGCLEIKAEGISAWLKGNKRHDKYYNPAPEKPEDEYWDILNPEGDYFAPKLAALIRAWRDATNPESEYFYKKHDTIKKAIEACLGEHAESWHLADEGKPLSNDSIARLARIANWDDKSGPKK